MIFQALTPLRPQWPLQPQHPLWPQWPLHPHFLKKITAPDGWIPPDNQITNTGLFFVEWIIKNPNFHWYWHLFCYRLLRSTNIIFLKNGWWNSNIQISRFQNHLQTNSTLHISICQSQFIKYVSIWDTLYVQNMLCTAVSSTLHMQL